MFISMSLFCPDSRTKELLLKVKQFIHGINSDTQYMITTVPYWKIEEHTQMEIYFPVENFDIDDLERSFKLLSEAKNISFHETDEYIEIYTNDEYIPETDPLFSVMNIDKRSNAEMIFGSSSL